MTTPAATSGFEALLDTLEPLLKSVPAASAVTPGQAKNDDGTPKFDAAGKPVMEAAAATAPAATVTNEPMGKSLTIKLEDGTEQVVFDATEMMKSFEKQSGDLTVRCGKLEEALVKSLNANIVMVRGLTEQGAMLKALETKVAELGAAGSGRKAVLTVIEKGPSQQAAATGQTVQEFGEQMMKAFHKGAVSADEVNLAETVMGYGKQPDADFVRRVADAVRT